MRKALTTTFALALLLAATAAAQEAGDAPYSVEIVGIEDEGLAGRVRDASRLVSLADRPAPGLGALERRAEDDRERIDEVLRSEGYYAASVDFDIGTGPPPMRVLVRVDPGPAFTIGRFDVEYRPPAGAKPPEPIPPRELGIETGRRARAETVNQAKAALLRQLAEQGYPLARIADSRIVVDHATETMRIALVAATGPPARFGPVTVTGLDEVDEAYVLRRVPWETGERFSLDKMERLRKALAESRLFTTVRLETADALNEGGLLPVTVALAEARHRSVGIGATWSTTEGLGGEAYWEHRNLFDGGERLRATAQAGEVINGLKLTYLGPDFLAARQDLIASASAQEERTDAFVTRSVALSSGLAWHLGETWRVSASGAFERLFEEEANRTRQFTLVSIPLEARHDGTDDILDPTRGNRFAAAVQPFVGALGATTDFTRVEVSDSHYFALSDSPRAILAGWARLGTIQGAKAPEVPADKRFYVGGPGSVRAFGSQLAGPVDESGDPVGGRSAFAFGTEARVKVTEEIGIVPFVEAGRAHPQPWPDFGARLFWGAGLGVRYHTGFGPIRADLAIPLNPRDGIDDSYQVYLSFGQAF